MSELANIETKLEELNRKMNFIVGINASDNPFLMSTDELKEAIEKLKTENDKKEEQIKECRASSEKLELDREFKLIAVSNKLIQILNEEIKDSEITDEEKELMRETDIDELVSIACPYDLCGANRAVEVHELIEMLIIDIEEEEESDVCYFDGMSADEREVGR